MDCNFYLKNIRNIKQNVIKIDHHIKNLCCYISVNKVPKGLKIKVTPHTPGIKTNNFSNNMRQATCLKDEVLKFQ